MTWHAVYQTKFGTKHLDVAERLHAAWRKEAKPEATKVKVVSLSTRIGKLIKHGDATGWWKQRPIVRRIFAEMLGLDPDAIFGAAPGAARGLMLPEFPKLPAIEPGEEPCRLDRDGWLLHLALRQLEKPLGGHVWIRAPAGAGKSLVIRYLQLRHATDFLAVSVSSVAAAAAHANSKLHLVVEIEAPNALEDAAAMGPLTTRTAPTIVLAPFDLPLEGTFWYGEALGGRNPAGWMTADGSPRGDWRGRMLDWIDARLERSERDTKLVKEDVLDWLQRHDARGFLIATPGDLLALCADFDTWGSDGAGLAMRARRWLEETGIGMLPEDTPSTWRRNAAAKAYGELVGSHLGATARVYGTLSAKAWEALLPAAVIVGTEDAPGATVALGYLRDGGLLRGAERGLMPYPSAVAQGIANEMLATAFEKPQPGDWGALAADETRQSVVDAALDAVSDGALRALLRSLAKRGKPTSLAELGAVEAALAALGRRLPAERPLRGRDLEAVQQLMLMQIDHLANADGRPDAHHPYTRHNSAEWFSTGWAVSLNVEPPAGFSRDELAWEIPGWAGRLQLSALERIWLPSSAILPWGAGVHVQRLAQLASGVVEKLEAGEVPAGVPRVLLPALFLAETERSFERAHLDRIASSWEETFLARVGAGLPDDRRAGVATRLWRLVAQSIAEDGAVPVAQRIEKLGRQHPGMASFVLGNLDAAELARTASTHGIHRLHGSRNQHPADPLELLRLPQESRRAAVRGWLEGAARRGSQWDEARELVPLLGADDLDLALELARAGDRKIASEFTSFVWRVAPIRAREEVELALQDNLPSVEGWFYQAPRQELPAMVGLIENRHPRPAWVARWASQRVLDGGDAAERLFRMAQT